jgi:hypothetical protein
LPLIFYFSYDLSKLNAKTNSLFLSTSSGLGFSGVVLWASSLDSRAIHFAKKKRERKEDGRNFKEGREVRRQEGGSKARREAGRQGGRQGRRQKGKEGGREGAGERGGGIPSKFNRHSFLKGNTNGRFLFQRFPTFFGEDQTPGMESTP